MHHVLCQVGVSVSSMPRRAFTNFPSVTVCKVSSGQQVSAAVAMPRVVSAEQYVRKAEATDEV